MCHPYNRGLAVVLRQFEDTSALVDYTDLFGKLEEEELRSKSVLNWPAVRWALRSLLNDGGLILGSDHKLRMTRSGVITKKFAESVAI